MIERYKQLKNTDKLKTNISAYRPTPTDKDYTVGYITRYFAQKVNEPNGVVTEINQKSFTRLKTSPVYLIDSIKWKIRKLSETDDEISVFNTEQVNKSKIQNLSVYLPNKREFERLKGIKVIR